ncbi:hypothetical protein PT974_03901 [Cladobotryum mycophilum]|uniref:Uncharacterized protein n=1 Tax=Cladobotryum mycophilum TaxID=491253 RepID=A0ABR0STP1_9HYPO
MSEVAISMPVRCESSRGQGGLVGTIFANATSSTRVSLLDLNKPADDGHKSHHQRLPRSQACWGEVSVLPRLNAGSNVVFATSSRSQERVIQALSPFSSLSQV